MISIEKLFSLKDHVVIVTGGSRGIGRTVASYLAAAGADVAIIGTKDDTAKKAADEIAAEFGVKTAGIACNVANREEVIMMVDRVEAILGIPDLLFNNAGICDNGPSECLTELDWRKIIDINLNGAFYVIQSVAKKLIDAGRPGAIVNMTSMSAHITCTPQHESAYNASKAGLLHLSRSLAVEWANKGIRVNCISPGYIMTEMTAKIADPDMVKQWLNLTPMGRLGREDELAGAVIYLLGDASTFTSGAEIIMDGAYTII
jgi:sorbose reductase